MSVDRLRRAGSLVDVRQSAVEAAQGTLAAAMRSAQEAERLAAKAEEAYQEACRAPFWERMSSVDLTEISAWLRSQRLRADRAAVVWKAAQAEAEREREALVAARSELRKLEVWRDGLATVERARITRLEQLATDEVAARTLRRRA